MIKNKSASKSASKEVSKEIKKVKLSKVNVDGCVPITFFADFEIASDFYSKLKSEHIEIENEQGFLASLAQHKSKSKNKFEDDFEEDDDSDDDDSDDDDLLMKKIKKAYSKKAFKKSDNDK